jgi:cell division septum initiation protein DivIVA
MQRIEDPRGRIERLEEEIAALEESVARCGKIMAAAQVAISVGVVALVAVFLGLLRVGGMGFVLAVSAILIGIVLFGSNRSTRDVLRAEIARKRAARDALIDAIAPRTVH